jgi:hypothetical protein
MTQDQIVPGYTQAAFDGRMKYFELLFKLLTESKTAGMLGDLSIWYRGLELSYNMIQPYIGAEREEIRKSLDTVRKEVFLLDKRGYSSQIANLRYRFKLDEKFLAIDANLHTAAKKLYLPVTEQGDELDVGAYLKKTVRESGL